MVSNEMLTYIVVGITLIGLALIAIATWAYYRNVDHVDAAAAQAVPRSASGCAKERMRRLDSAL